MSNAEITAGESLKRVLANPSLRRVQGAFAGSVLGDWAYATALTVWAYTDGGAAAVGIFQAVRFLAMAVAGPLGAVVADRVSRKTFMMTTDLIRAVLVSLAAVLITVDGPSLAIYALGLLTAVVGAPFRAAQAGLIPQLVESPDQLTSSNAISANIENVVVFAGPALGAAMVGLLDVQSAFWLNAVSYVWSFLLVAGVHVTRTTPEVHAEEGDSVEEEAEEFLAEVTAGFSTVAKDKDLRTVALLAAAQGFTWGALTVFMVIIAIDQLHAGPEGVGYLNAIMGGATILGGIIVLSRTTKGRLGADMVTGVLGWSIPLLALAAFPSPVTAVLALAVIGLADPFVNLGFETIPQRIASARVISRVYAAAESALIGAMALGAAIAPFLIHHLGFRGAMLVPGIGVSVYALSALAHMRSLDKRLMPPAELPLLRSIALFAPLSPPTLESLARRLVRLEVQAGETVVAEGEPSDSFYIIESGVIEVTQAGRLLRREWDGNFFGEIGLLRDVPRTATCTALRDSTLLVLDRSDFLEAVVGVQESRVAAEEIVSRRLAV